MHNVIYSLTPGRERTLKIKCSIIHKRKGLHRYGTPSAQSTNTLLADISIPGIFCAGHGQLHLTTDPPHLSLSHFELHVDDKDELERPVSEGPRPSLAVALRRPLVLLLVEVSIRAFTASSLARSG